MTPKEIEFQKHLLATFNIEAQDHLAAMTAGLISLEKAGPPDQQQQTVETVFREAHSLKGAARAVNLVQIETVCQALEDLLAALKRKELGLGPELFDLLHRTIDAMHQLLKPDKAFPASPQRASSKELIRCLENALKERSPAVQSQPVPAPAAPESLMAPPQAESSVSESRPIMSETVRVATAKLDVILLHAEELIAPKLAARRRAEELQQVRARLGSWGKQWTQHRSAVRALQSSLLPSAESPAITPHASNPPWRSVLEFLDWSHSFWETVEMDLGALGCAAEQDQRVLSGMVDHLLGDLKQVLMQPFGALADTLPRLVRDLARDQSKEVDLLIQGAEIEIDRRILAEMKDPLIHMVRNSVDHGIEKPDERRHKGKPARGTITLSLAQKSGSHVELVAADDGAGIDLDKVKSAAVRLGLISPADAGRLTAPEVQSLVFHSGVSTSPMITDLSGRGLGLAIVREKVEKLGGAISLETVPGRSTTFRIVLPITLATFRGVIISVEQRLFVIPTAGVERVVRVNLANLKTVANRKILELDGHAVALVPLAAALELPQRQSTDPAPKFLPALVLASGGKRIAFLVDAVLQEEEVLVKNLGPQLARVRNLAGATILGTGKVVPILHLPDLMKSAVRASDTPAPRQGPTLKEKEKAILVAEDSITSRTLLKNILVSAGYRVETAVDGIDAFTQLRSGEFDLVVSDVDMPRMKGLDLTAKIRADKKLAQTPVVLVTALESRQDRERGIEVGANAYIVKSSFDQANLLEVIRRLV